MTQEFCIRRLRNEDADDIVALYDRASMVDRGIGPISRLTWLRFIELPQNRNGQDLRIAERDGQLIGVAEYSLKDQGERKVRFCKIVVDPAARRRRVASCLMTELLAIDRPNDNLALQSLCAGDWSGIGFLNALGFSYIESELSMHCTRLITPSVAPQGAPSIERVAQPARYAADVARIHNTAFRADVAFRHYSPEEMLHVLESSELWLVMDSGQIVGFCQIALEPEAVWLESIAIDPTRQGRGLGQALAYRALEAAEISPQHPAGLNVSSVNRAAINIYQRLGFEVRRERRRYTATHGQLVALLAR